MAAKPRPVCVHCQQAIAYGEDYYLTQPHGEPPYQYVHAACLEKAERQAEREVRKAATA